MDKARILRRDLLAALQASPSINPDKIGEILRYAEGAVTIRMRPGFSVGSGFGVTPTDVASFVAKVADPAQHPGWSNTPSPTQAAVSADAATFSAEDFRCLSPADRLRLINRGVRRTEEGKIERVYAAAGFK